MLEVLDLFSSYLTCYMSPTSTVMYLPLDTVSRINQIASGDHTYFVIRDGRHSEIVKYIHNTDESTTAHAGCCTASVGLLVERDVANTGAYGFPAGACVSFEYIGPVIGEYVGGRFTDCDKQPIHSGSAIATCENLDAAVSGNAFYTADTTTLKLSGNGKAGTPLSGDVQISNDAGNTVQVRSDGLYVGGLAPADIAQLYVSSVFGLDTNTGTREFPLRTLHEAFRRQVNSPVGYRIYLRAGETFPLAERAYRALANFIIYPYDDDFLEAAFAKPACPGYLPWVAQEINRPTIVLNWFDVGNYYELCGVEANTVDIRSVNIQLVAPPINVDINDTLFTFATNQLTLLGVKVIYPSSGGRWLYQSETSRLQQVVITNTSTDGGLVATDTRKPTVVSVDATGTLSCPGYDLPTITPIGDNVRSIPIQRLIMNPVLDGTRPVNFDINWIAS